MLKNNMLEEEEVNQQIQLMLPEVLNKLLKNLYQILLIYRNQEEAKTIQVNKNKVKKSVKI
jgi:hypothetical protein